MSKDNKHTNTNVVKLSGNVAKKEDNYLVIIQNFKKQDGTEMAHSFIVSVPPFLGSKEKAYYKDTVKVGDLISIKGNINPIVKDEKTTGLSITLRESTVIASKKNDSAE